MLYKGTKPGLVSVLYLSMHYTVLLFIRAPFLCIVSFPCYVFCLLVVLVKLSVIAKWLARKSPLKKPNRGKGIVSRLKISYDFLGLFYCFIILLCIFVVSWYMIYFPTFMARYCLFVLKVPLNPKQTDITNHPTVQWSMISLWFGSLPAVIHVPYTVHSGIMCRNFDCVKQFCWLQCTDYVQSLCCYLPIRLWKVRFYYYCFWAVHSE